MTEFDWIQLWVLNEVVAETLTLWVYANPSEYCTQSYWSFPSDFAYNANARIRIEAVLEATRQGWVQLYHQTELASPRFGGTDQSPVAFPVETVEHLNLEDDESLRSIQVTLTESGFARWEREFEPDWDRWWRPGREWEEDTDHSLLEVVYTSNSFYDELLHWLPFYRNFDPKFGLQEVRCQTLFQEQIVPWKVLPYVKFITWRVRPDRTFQNRLEEIYQSEETHEVKLARTSQVLTGTAEEGSLSQQADATLRRLSKRWTEW